jgi:hypothetical protein
MKVRRVVLSIILVGILLAVVGCENYFVQHTQISKVSIQPTAGNTLRTLTTKSNRYYPVDGQLDVQRDFEEIANSGEYNLVSVKTTYAGMCLAMAEIVYDASTRGDGNNVRVMFIFSNKYFIDQKDKEIRPRLGEIVGSENYDIVKVSTPHVKGYWIAAEVYYREKPSS